ncbi:MAG: NAD(P)/FAD-dependent oxidoreductase [Oscillospiraceae bacterium]|nr:NAD(P)/FAD-dependent oxidoreductase [Oscillospiraceae bacterium]
MSDQIDIAVIGGGAAGLMAAITAANALKTSGKVVIFERGQRVGRKLLATGNGRCNLSNRNASPEHYHGADPDFVRSAFKKFSVKSNLDLFYKMGLLTVEEEEGKLYPRSLQAAAVVDILRLEADLAGVTTLCETEVTAIRPRKGGFSLETSAGSFSARTVILAAGGEASASLGGTDSGYRLLSALGHKITDRKPAIVQLQTDVTHTKALSGLKIDGIVTITGKEPVSRFGEILFTDYGISGPPVMTLSSLVVRRLGGGRTVTLSLDIVPDMEPDRLRKILSGKASSRPDRKLEDYLTGILPKRIGQAALKAAGIAPLSRTAGSLAPAEIDALCRQLKDWKITVTSHNGMKNAQVTAGGAETAGFYPDTLASKKVPGLFACGEVLDIDGDCGGYNLQWAWSSGRLAAESAVHLLQK